MTVALYAKQDDSVICKVFSNEDALVAQEVGWADEPKKAKKVSDDDAKWEAAAKKVAKAAEDAD